MLGLGLGRDAEKHKPYNKDRVEKFNYENNIIHRIDMEDFAIFGVEAAIKLGADYADTRIEKARSESVTAVNDRNESFACFNQGFGIRIIADGAWGYASSNTLTHREALKIADLAVRTGKANARTNQQKVRLADCKTVTDNVEYFHKKNPFDISVEEKIERIENARDVALDYNDRVKLARASLLYCDLDKIFASSEGSLIRQHFVATSCQVESWAVEGRKMQKKSLVDAQMRGWEFVDDFSPRDKAMESAKIAVNLLSGVKCPTGRTTIVMDPANIGLLIHEAVGHPCELDRVLGMEDDFAGGSFVTPEKLGRFRFGSDLVTLVDDSTIAGKLGSYRYDDEGVLGQRRILVKDGIFNEYITSRETAAEIGLPESNGGCRATAYRFMPLVRQSNTYLEGGDASLEEMLEGVDRGIYFGGRSEGYHHRQTSIDDKRINFHQPGPESYLIEKGEITKPIWNASFQEYTYEFWRKCDMVGKDVQIFGTGCGKGVPWQPMWAVGLGGAHARFKDIRIGVY